MWFLIGIAVGFFAALAWINRAWVIDKLSGLKFIDK